MTPDPAPGLVWRLRPSDTSIALLGHMADQMPRLEAETEMEIGWINNGGLFVANNRQRFDEYQRLSTIGSAMGVENQMLGPSEVNKVSHTRAVGKQRCTNWLQVGSGLSEVHKACDDFKLVMRCQS